MSVEKIPDDDGSKLLRLYLYYAGQTESLVNRRGANSRYFLTVNAGLSSLTGLMLELEPGGKLWLAILPVAGIVVCAVWWLLTRSYRILTKARFDVITEIETRLPAAPYTDEWQMIKKGPAYSEYKSIARQEAIVPLIFVALYLIFLIAIIVM
ncbi:MAG: hypothetical protein AAF414_05365 [Pseudomonadota bacterium]